MKAELFLEAEQALDAGGRQRHVANAGYRHRPG
jgi:hypothetical protein